MTKRHKDALAISDGAVNPSGMALALASACRECLNEKVPQQDDAAVRLIVSQIAYICGIWDGVDNWSRGPQFDEAREECKKKVEDDTTALARSATFLTSCGATDAQLDALYKVYERSADGAADYTEFASRAHYANLIECVMVPWCGMWLGIEKDGYTHS